MKKIWLFSAPTDILTLFAPVWAVWALCFFLPDTILQTEIPLWVWVVVVLGIDVSHVWSTLFRTYLDKEELHNHKKILIAAPLVSLVLLIAVTSISIQLFYTLLAYFAVYHFIKQQYGFMRIYQGRYGKTGGKFFNDTFIIYLGMLYPVFFWHLNSDRAFYWFVEGDFIPAHVLSPGWLNFINLLGSSIYFLLLGGWLIEEVIRSIKENRKTHYGKIFWVVTTALNWYLGIVYFNSDLAFTLTNVVAHGVPYMALVFVYVKRKKEIKTGSGLQLSKTIKILLFIIGGALLLAFLEEYFWDMLLYRDNPVFFQAIMQYPFQVLEHPMAQAGAIALLALPQVTHYVLDGYIWKSNASNPFLKRVLFSQ